MHMCSRNLSCVLYLPDNWNCTIQTKERTELTVMSIPIAAQTLPYVDIINIRNSTLKLYVAKDIIPQQTNSLRFI